MPSHLEEKLQQDIVRIRDKVREMADLAVRGLEDSVKALTTGDNRMAYVAILRDSRVDKLESLIDALCVEFIVRHIPVAAHLRFVHSVAKIVSEIERVGDYAESINRLSILLGGDRGEDQFDKFERLAAVSIDMTRQAVRSFLDEDLELADKTTDLDAKADRLHQEIYNDLQSEIPVGKEDLARLFTLLSIANRYERVADQACNICDEVNYIVTGEVVKHRLHTDLQILFVSSIGSCHSLIAERIASAVAGDNFDFFSADLEGRVPSPQTAKFLEKKSLDVSGLKTKTLAEVGDLSRFKALVAIGERAAQALPQVGYRQIVLEWDVADPSAAPPEEAEEAYARAFNELLDFVKRLIRSFHGTVSSSSLGVGE